MESGPSTRWEKCRPPQSKQSLSSHSTTGPEGAAGAAKSHGKKLIDSDTSCPPAVATPSHRAESYRAVETGSIERQMHRSRRIMYAACDFLYPRYLLQSAWVYGR